MGRGALSRRAALVATGAAIAAPRAWAQIPPPPYVYILGQDRAHDIVSNGRIPVPKGRPDVWLRAIFRNLSYYQGHTGWNTFIKQLVLRTTGGPYHQWDTIPYSKYPLLLVESDGKRVNREDSGIAGFVPPEASPVDLFIAEDGSIAARVIPLELEVTTLDGSYVMNVALHNFADQRPL